MEILAEVCFPKFVL